jgi:hypothetical protein
LAEHHGNAARHRLGQDARRAATDFNATRLQGLDIVASALSMIGVHMPYTSIEDCRKYAVVCEREFALTSDSHRKETMLELAQQWRHTAESFAQMDQKKKKRKANGQQIVPPSCR